MTLDCRETTRIFYSKLPVLDVTVVVAKAPFTLQKILGTARIKVVRVPKKIVLIGHLHVLSSTVLNDLKLCFGAGKRLDISASVLDSCRFAHALPNRRWPKARMLIRVKIARTANRLHCTPYPSWARFSGLRTNFVRARTTSRHGLSTGESLVQHGWGKVVYTTKSIRAEPIFLVRILFSSASRAKIFRQCKWGLKLLYPYDSILPPR